MRMNRMRRYGQAAILVLLVIVTAGATYPEAALFPGPPMVPPPLPGSYADRTQHLDTWSPRFLAHSPAPMPFDSTWPVQSSWNRLPYTGTMPLILQDQAYPHVRTFRYSTYSQILPFSIDRSAVWAARPYPYQDPNHYDHAGGVLP